MASQIKNKMRKNIARNFGFLYVLGFLLLISIIIFSTVDAITKHVSKLLSSALTLIMMLILFKFIRKMAFRKTMEVE